MKYILFVLTGLITGTLHPQLLLKIYKDSIVPYSYSGGDEFNAPELGSGWNNGLWPRVIMAQDLAFSPGLVKQKEGLAIFTAVKRDSIYIMGDIEIDSSFLKRKHMSLVQNKFLTKYSAGLIYSKKKYHFGLYELRFKVEKGKGIWPAFWFYGGNKNEEIDAFELKGEKNNEIHVDTHCPNGCDRNYNNHKLFNTNWGGWLPISDYLHDGFNIMLLEWKPGEVIWYINGYPLAYFKGSLPNPMNLYLNTSVAKNGEAFNPGPDETTTWPNNYYVDYIRVWHPVSGNAEHLALKANDSCTLSGKFESRYGTCVKKKRGLNYDKQKLNKIAGMLSLTLTSKHELVVTGLGLSGKPGASIKIKGIISGQSYAITDFTKETVIHLDPSEKTIELSTTINKKTYTRIIDLK